jgi:subtilisin family serine protease
VSDAASFVPASPAALDSNGHGSHVAGTIAAKGIVTASVAPRARLMTAKVFAATGGAFSSTLIEAIVWCADNGAHVINMSLGGLRFIPPGTTIDQVGDFVAYRSAVAYAHSLGTVVVAAAMNTNIQFPNPQQTFFPAFLPGVLSVGATGPTSKTYAIDVNPDPAIVTPATVPVAFAPAWDPTNPAHVWQGPDAKAFYSNFGTAVSLFAPGGRGGIPLSFVNRIALVPGGLPGVRTVQGGPYDNIMSVCSSVTAQFGRTNVGGGLGPNGSCAGDPARYIAYAGTSMAAPHVAGAAAVLYAQLGGTRSGAARQRVINCMRTTTDNIGPATTFGGGRLSVARAVAALTAGSC